MAGARTTPATKSTGTGPTAERPREARPDGAASNPYGALLRLQSAAGNGAIRRLIDGPAAPGETGLSPLQRLRQSYFAGDHRQALSFIEQGKGSGSALPATLQTLTRHYLGHDFTQVRIHTDAFAARAAANLDANAFTVGRDIFFGQGMYAPHQPQGWGRLTHELAHTLQQRGADTPVAGYIAALEAQAEQAAASGLHPGATLLRVGPIILREPTYPRRTTGTRMIAEAERVLNLTRDTNSTDEVNRRWSGLASNFPTTDTAGTIARRVWTHVFLRHFVEPESAPGVESSHPRYFYSHTYGWVDGQHFFGFIDFAEQQYQSSGGNRQQAFDAATAQGLSIEQQQQQVRDYVVLGRPPSSDPTLRLMQVRPPNTSLFRSPQMVAQGAVTLGATLYGLLRLQGTQGELFAQLNTAQRDRFFADSAKSAFTYEDFQSNQLGTRFFFQHGQRINTLAAPARIPSFLSALVSFFNSINVENNSARVDRLATDQHLPGRERFEAPKTTEEAVRRQHPDLFQLPR